MWAVKPAPGVAAPIVVSGADAKLPVVRAASADGPGNSRVTVERVSEPNVDRSVSVHTFVDGVATASVLLRFDEVPRFGLKADWTTTALTHRVDLGAPLQRHLVLVAMGAVPYCLDPNTLGVGELRIDLERVPSLAVRLEHVDPSLRERATIFANIRGDAPTDSVIGAALYGMRIGFPVAMANDFTELTRGERRGGHV